jgi:hypothetical protein
VIRRERKRYMKGENKRQRGVMGMGNDEKIGKDREVRLAIGRTRESGNE